MEGGVVFDFHCSSLMAPRQKGQELMATLSSDESLGTGDTIINSNSRYLPYPSSHSIATTERDDDYEDDM